MERIMIKTHGNPQHLLAAYAALESVQPRNVSMTDDFGEPYTITAGGKCNTVANPAGWVAQFPHFKTLGVKLEERLIRGEKKYIPTFKMPDGRVAIGYNALAYAMEMDIQTVLHTFSPGYYPSVNGEDPRKDVLRRLKTVLNKAGAGDQLKAHLKAQKAGLKPKKAPKAAKTAKKGKKAGK